MRRVEVHHLPEYRVKKYTQQPNNQFIFGLDQYRVYPNSANPVNTFTIVKVQYNPEQAVFTWVTTNQSEIGSQSCLVSTYPGHTSPLLHILCHLQLLVVFFYVCGFLKRQALGVRAQDWH